jgi:nitrite reductase/ring-hydroxylating ferredoxin subunit
VIQPTLERRHFILGCAAAASVAACSGGTTTTGNYDDAGGGGDDAGDGGDDASTSSDDASDAASSACPSTAKDTGKKPADFAQGTATYFPSVVGFVVRDAGGLYALTAICTHAGCTVTARSSTGFTCPCHGATFDENGNATGGPVSRPSSTTCSVSRRAATLRSTRERRSIPRRATRSERARS